MPVLSPNEVFREICRQIRDHGWTEAEWSKHCYEDMFQRPRYNGGYVADEGDGGPGAFWFSWYDPDDKEWWFRVSLQEVIAFATGGELQVTLLPPLRRQ